MDARGKPAHDGSRTTTVGITAQAVDFYLSSFMQLIENITLFSKLGSFGQNAFSNFSPWVRSAKISARFFTLGSFGQNTC
jgi:hypothetical protein